MDPSAWLSELKRRRVFRAVLAYGIASFAILQVAEPVMHGLHLPDWILSAVVVLLGLGFPVTVLLAWAFDLRSTGIERTPPSPAPAGPSPGDVPAAPRARAALLAGLVALGLALAAPGVTWFFVSRTRPAPAPSSAGVPAGPSVAVLPFADMSPGRDQEYLADGIAEEILNALAHVPGLRVPGRTSSFWFKGKDTKPAAIARELGVRTLLEGSVRRDGNRIRVTAQLVDAGDGYHLWSETFERNLTDVFQVQEEISRAVAGALRVKLLAGSAGARHAYQPRIEAYEQYLLGRQLRNAGSPASMAAARDAFARAVALDPRYAAAHAGLAQAWGDVAGYLSDTPDQVTRAALLELASAERAIALEPDLPDGYVARAGHRLAYAWDWKGALADVERARSLDPSPQTASWQLAGALVSLGRLPEAVAAARQGTEADPLSPSAWTRLCRTQLAEGDAMAAEASCRRALTIAPDNGTATASLGFVLLRQGRNDEALAIFRNHPFPFFRLTGLAVAHHALGRERESQAALDELVATQSLNAAYQIAEVHAYRGENDQAFEWLERARVQHDEGLEHVRADHLLRGIHSDPRWNAFLRKMNFPVD